MKPMVCCAQTALLEESRRSLPSTGIAPVGVAPPGVATPGAARSLAPPSSLERRVIVRLDELAAKGKLLGAQVCLRLGGRAVVDVCAGRKGVVDARAVSNADLFQVFEAGNVLVATLVLEQIRQGHLALDSDVGRILCDAKLAQVSALQSSDLQSSDLQSSELQSSELQSSDLQSSELQSSELQSSELQSSDVHSVSVAQLLGHASGLSGAMPPRAKLSELRPMERYVAERLGSAAEGAAPSPAAA